MEVIKYLFKIVENPKSIKNYLDLKEYFKQKGEKNISEALEYLMEKKYAADNNIDNK